MRNREKRKPSALSTSARGPPARSHGLRRLRRLAARDPLSFERATFSRDVARIRRILAACRTSSGNVVRTQRVLTASGKSPISCNGEKRVASFDPRASAAVRPVVSSRGSAARVAGSAGNLFHGGHAVTLAARGTAGPSRSSAHGADCLREPQAHSRLASPGERRAPEFAAQGAANVGVRRMGGR